MSVTLLDKSSFELSGLYNCSSDTESSGSEGFDDLEQPQQARSLRVDSIRKAIETTPIKTSSKIRPERSFEYPEPGTSPSEGGPSPEYPEFSEAKKHRPAGNRSFEYPEYFEPQGDQSLRSPSPRFPEDDSETLVRSPEIKYSSPIRYTFVQKNNTTIILKKSMSRRVDKRLKKCSQKDIAAMLENDDDDEDYEEIYDGRSKTRSMQKTLSKEKQGPNIYEGRIRMTLRRSTEQSNYKIEQFDADSRRRRASVRTITTPSRYRDHDQDASPRKYSTRSTKSLHYDGENDNEKEDQVARRTRSQRSQGRQVKKENASSPKTPTKLRHLRSTSSATKVTRQQTSKLSSPDDNSDELKSSQMNKENKLGDSTNIDRSSRKLAFQDQPMTPRKRNRILKEAQVTPKKKTTVLEEVKTPRSSRSLARIAEDCTTPKRTPRKMTQIIEEPVTPKRKIPTSRAQTPSVKIGSLTPSMRQRTINIEKPKTILEEARAQLHVSAVPKSLPCREQEFNDVFTFLERKLVDHSGGCIYISGVPGTGKTATVNEAIRCLRKLVTKGALQPFDYVEINGMKMSEPRQSYVQILKQLTGQTATWEEARSKLENRFIKRKVKGSMTLLLIDELDILCNKRQDVVYNLLDWPSKPAAQLVVITIANTMDLPERVLMSRVTSRLGLTRLTFQPYNHKQLQEIIIARLKESDAFKSDAVQLVARKVAAVSGDARRALDICRRATEIAEANRLDIVSMLHVNEALTEMIANAKVRAIRHCSEMEKVFLQAVCAEIERTGVEETSFKNVCKQLEALCSFEGVKSPNVTESLMICNRLSSHRLLLCDNPRWEIEQKIFLNVSSDDVYFALKDISQL